MKNNTLKKISAVALAAVMAVTFAPVASLQVFANSAKAVTVSGASNGANGDYSKLSDAVNALIGRGSTTGTITINENLDTETNKTYGAQTVTGGSLYFKGTDKGANASYTLDLSKAGATSIGDIVVDSNVDLKIVDTETSGTAAKVGSIIIGHQGAVKDAASNLTIDIGNDTIDGIDATFANITLESGVLTTADSGRTVTGSSLKFEAGIEGTVNNGATSISPTIGKSSFTMNGGWVQGLIRGAEDAAFAEKQMTKPDGTPIANSFYYTLQEGLGAVTINAGTFTLNPLGNTNANYKYDWEKYSDKSTGATFGFYKTADYTNGQNASMIGDTPVVRLDLGENNKTPNGSIGNEDLYYAGQAFIDKLIASIDDGENYSTYKNWLTNTKQVNVEVVANATKINNAPWGTIVSTVHKKTGTVVSPTSVEVIPASGLSKLDKKVVDKADANRVTTTYTTYVGDKTIINEVGKSLEDYKKDLTDVDADSDAVFKNGGDSLEIVADGKTYVTPSVINGVLSSAKEIKVVELTKRAEFGNGFKYALLGSLDPVFELADTSADYKKSAKKTEGITNRGTTLPADVTNGVNKDAKVTADAKYTVVSTTKDGKRYVTVTNARVLNNDKTGVELVEEQLDSASGTVAATKVLSVPIAPFVSGKNGASAVVEQIGTGALKDSADEILFVENASVSTVDKDLALANNDSATVVGEKAAQLAAVSADGRNIYTEYFVAGKQSWLPRPYSIGTVQTYTQGNVYLKEVPRNNGGVYFNGNGWTEAVGAVWDKDAVHTWVEFVDGSNVGITKTPNVTTNAYGVKMVSSVNVTVGAGTNAPQSVYRFRNTKNGEHLYTIQLSEINNLLKSDEWVLENANAFTVLPYNTTVAGAVPVRRYHNIKTNEFLYSTDVNGEQKALDADPNWVREGIAFCGLPTGQGYAVTRVTNTIFGGHVYSTSVKSEVTPLVESGRGYKVDGVVFNAVDTPEKEK